MKPRLYALLKVLLCFLLLYILRDWIVFAYRSVLEPIGLLLLSADMTDFNCGEICSLRLVAYLSLVLSTSKMRMSRRLLAVLVGLMVFVCIDLAGLYLWPEGQTFNALVDQTYFQLAYGFVWNLLRDLLLPFLLWVVVFDRHMGLFLPDAPADNDLEKRGSFGGG